MKLLLNILRDGQFHSGEALGGALGISRSAVWKRLQKLESDLGVRVHAVKGRGYKLERPVSLLNDAAALQAAAGVDVHIYDSLDSTNAQAQRMLQAGAAPPFIVFAERQTAGRGRRGRGWVSPFAENLYCSSVVQVDGGARALEALPLSVGLAVRQTLEDAGVVDLGLKWPNDVHASGMKIAGILLEVSGDPADRCQVVIGVGVNLNMLSASGIEQSWTSVALQLERHLVDRQAFAALLCERLAQYLKRHFQYGFTALREEWERYHLWRGRQALLSVGEGAVQGVVVGVGDDGSLQMQVDGVLRSFSGGELSLRLANDS